MWYLRSQGYRLDHAKRGRVMRQLRSLTRCSRSPSDVRRNTEPGGSFIERAECDQHYDRRRFPGLHIPKQPPLRLVLVGSS